MKDIIIKEGTAQEIEFFANNNFDIYSMTDFIKNNGTKTIIVDENPANVEHLATYTAVFKRK